MLHGYGLSMVRSPFCQHPCSFSVLHCHGKSLDMEQPPIRRQEYTRQSTTWFGGVHPPPCFGIRMSWPTFLGQIPSISIVSGSVHVVSLELVNRICVFALPSCFMEACGWTPKVGVVEDSLWPWILLTKGWQVHRRIIVEYMRESERTTLSWYIQYSLSLLRPQVPTVGDPRKPGFNRFGTREAPVPTVPLPQSTLRAPPGRSL